MENVIPPPLAHVILNVTKTGELYIMSTSIYCLYKLKTCMFYLNICLNISKSVVCQSIGQRNIRTHDIQGSATSFYGVTIEGKVKPVW